MEYAYASDAGLCREVNEDTVGIFSVGDFFTVALLLDGMGGANGGKTASSLAYKVMMTELELRLSFLMCGGDTITHKEIGNVLMNSLDVANYKVFELSRQDRSLRGMGTTMVAAVLYGNHCCILNVGDSRGYYLADSQITQITKDQSYLQYLLDSERIDERDAEHFSEKNVIMHAVGTEEEIYGDLYYLTFSCQSDEYLLLSSDGLHDMVSNDYINKIIFEKNSLRAKVRNLIKAANKAGGDDNISVLLIRK